jgi:MoaA/NifB/PqqE/SkfB family radical SAM enzyme
VDPLRIALREDGQRADLSTDEVKALIDRAMLDGARTVVLTGGEVSIRKDFQEIVQHASRKGLNIVIQTNGRGLSNATRCAFLAEVPAVFFVVAVHGPDAQTHEAVTMVKGSFAQTLRGIENLQRLSKPLATKTVISRLNEERLLGTMYLAKSLGVGETSIVFPHAKGFAESRFLSVVPRYNSIASQIEATAEFAEKCGLSTSYETIPYCVCPESVPFWKRSLDLHAKARDKGCVPSQGLPSTPEAPDWEMIRPQMKAKFPQCRQCLLTAICEGVWSEYAEHFGGSEFHPILEVSGMVLDN